jgi:hypothetical protein
MALISQNIHLNVFLEGPLRSQNRIRVHSAQYSTIPPTHTQHTSFRSMAEAIALIASVITIAGICVDTCRIISAKGDAPAVFATIAIHLDAQLENLKLIENDLDERLRNDLHLDLGPLTKVIVDCKENMMKLRKFVDTCNVDATDKIADRIKKVWATYVKNKGKSAEKLVANVKQSLEELFQHNTLSNLVVLKSQLGRLDEFVSDVSRDDEFPIGQDERSQFLVIGDHATQYHIPGMQNENSHTLVGSQNVTYNNNNNNNRS